MKQWILIALGCCTVLVGCGSSPMKCTDIMRNYVMAGAPGHEKEAKVLRNHDYSVLGVGKPKRACGPEVGMRPQTYCWKCRNDRGDLEWIVLTYEPGQHRIDRKECPCLVDR